MLRNIRDRFSLTLLFGGISVLLFVAGSLAAFLVFQRATRSSLVHVVEQENTREAAHLISMAAGVSGIGPIYAGQIDAATSTARAATLGALLKQSALPASVLSSQKTMDIVGAIVWNPSGDPVWRFGLARAHEGSDPGLSGALAGTVFSKLELGEEVTSTSGPGERIDVVETYVPVRTGPNGPVVGVFEIYKDATGAYASIVSELRGDVLRATGMVMGGLLLAMLAAIFLADRAVFRSRQRTEAEQRMRRRHVESLAQVARAVNSDLNLEAVYTKTASSLQDIVPYDRMSITLTESGGNRVAFTWGTAVPPFDVGGLLPDPSVAPGTIVVPVQGEHKEAGLSSWIRVPLGRSGQPIGHLNLFRRENASFSDDEMALVEEMAHQVSAAIDNARLFDLTRQDAQEREVLAEISRLASSSQSIFELYEGLAERVRRLIPCSQLSLFVFDAEDSGNAWVCCRGAMTSKAVGDTAVPSSTLPFGEILDLEGPKVYRGEALRALTHRWTELGWASDGGAQAVIMAPINSVSGPLGALAFEYANGDEIPNPHVRLAEQVSAQVAGAIANLQAFSQVRLQSAALESAGEAIMIVDREGRIEYVNDAFETITGFSKRDARDLTPGQGSGPSPVLGGPSILAALKKGQSWSGTVTGFRKNGTSYPEEITVSPVRFDSDHSPRFIVVRRDITERIEGEEAKRINTELDTTNRELQREIAARVQMVSTVAHELKNPLSVVQGFVQLLGLNRDGNLTARQLDRLRMVEQSSQRLNALIDDLLEVSRVEGGRMRLEPTEFDVVASTRDIIESLSPMTRARRQRVLFETRCPSLTVFLDRNRYVQVLSNLLSNASKYSPEGGPIEVSLDSDGREFRLGVRDHGIGIAKDDQQQLFTPFFRVNNPETRAQPGTGLGLVIVKSIIELHGGYIHLDSSPGAGTEVSATLPCRFVSERSGGQARYRGERLGSAATAADKGAPDAFDHA